MANIQQPHQTFQQSSQNNLSKNYSQQNNTRQVQTLEIQKTKQLQLKNEDQEMQDQQRVEKSANAYQPISSDKRVPRFNNLSHKNLQEVQFQQKIVIKPIQSLTNSNPKLVEQADHAWAKKEGQTLINLPLGGPYIQQIQAPVIEANEEAKPVNEHQDVEMDSNFAQDSSMKSAKLLNQERILTSLSQKSVNTQENRLKERQEWRKNLMAKQAPKMLQKETNLHDDLQGKDLLQPQNMKYYNVDQINQMLLMKQLMMNPYQLIAENLFHASLSHAAECGSNTSHFAKEEQDKPCDFKHLNKPMSEVESKQENVASQNLNKINNQGYIQVTQSYAISWYQSKLKLEQYDLNTSIFKDLQQLFQIQKENTESLQINFSGYVFYSDLLKSQILKMDHLQLQNEFNYHCKEYVTDYLKSQNTQVQTDHLIFLQRKFTIQEIFDETIARQKKFTEENPTKVESNDEEQKFERENIQFKQAQQISQQFQSILPKNIALSNDDGASHSQIVKNVGNAQRLATMIKILQEKKPIEPNQNNPDYNMVFESYVQPSPKNSQTKVKLPEQNLSKQTMKVDLLKTVKVLEQMMKLLGDTSTIAQKNKTNFQNDISKFIESEKTEIQSTEQPITNQQQHILLNELKKLELLSPQNKANQDDPGIAPYTQEIIQHFIQSIQVNLNYLLILIKVQSLRIHRDLETNYALLQQKDEKNTLQKQSDKATQKYKSDYCNQKLLAYEIKQFFSKFKSLFEQLREISVDLIPDIQSPKFSMNELQALKIQNNQQQILEQQSKILPPIQSVKKRVRKARGAKNESNQMSVVESVAKKPRAKRGSKKIKQLSSQASVVSQSAKLKIQKQDSSIIYPSDVSPTLKIFQVQKIQRKEESQNFPLQLITNQLSNQSLWDDSNFNQGQINSNRHPIKQKQNMISSNFQNFLETSAVPINHHKILNTENREQQIPQESKVELKVEIPVENALQSQKTQQELYKDETYYLNEDLIPKSRPRETRSRKCKEKLQQAQTPSKTSNTKAKPSSKEVSDSKAEAEQVVEQQGQTLQRLNQEQENKQDLIEKKQETEQNESGQNQKNCKNKKKRNNNKREQTDNESTIKNPNQNKVQKTENIQQIEEAVQQIIKKPQGRSKKKQTPVEPKSVSQTPPQTTAAKEIPYPKSPKVTQRAAAIKSSLAMQSGIMTQDNFGPQDITLEPSQRYSLVNCDGYPSFEQQPYRIYFTFEVQMLMYIHSYLSKNEVIGLLGGISYDTKIHIAGHEGTVKNLVITKIYTADSCIKSPNGRQKNCEISDEEQIKISTQMEKDKVQKLAWYHSHPIFEVDPSMQDICTHYSQQNNFSREGKPFFGVIVGPYWKSQDVTETQIMVFNLKEQSSKSKNALRTSISNLKDRARKLQFKIIPNTKLKYTTYSEIKKMIQFSANHKIDKPEMNAQWTQRRGNLGTKYQFKEKFMLSLKKMCEDNLTFQNQDYTKEIMQTLISQDDKDSLNNQLTTQDVYASIQLMQQQNQLNANMERLRHIRADTQDMRRSQLELQRQIQFDYAQFQEQLQINTSSKFFSIGDSKKITKYLTKIEQALIKEFKLKADNQMEQTYKQQKDQDQNISIGGAQETKPFQQQAIPAVSNRAVAGHTNSASNMLQMGTVKPMNNQTGQGMQRDLEEIDLGGNGEEIDLKALYEKQNESQNQ